jgi:DNA-binding CsgD family transcriptional regulator
MRTKQSRLAGHIRRLCSLGLDPAIVVPDVVEAVRQIAGADWGMFFFTDRQGHVADIYSQNNDIFTLLPKFMEQRYVAPEREIFGVDFESCMARGHGWENTVAYEQRLINTRVYDEMWKPICMRHSIEVTAVDGASGRGIGCLQLSRGQSGRRFTANERASITAFGRHIAHALHAPRVIARQHTRSATEATLLVDGLGRILMTDHHAARLLALAHDRPVMEARCVPRSLPAWMLPVLHRLQGIDEDRAELPPKVDRLNSKGHFVFRAYRLRDLRGKTDADVIAIHAWHHLPVALALETSAFHLGLSAQQRRVCEALLSGASHSEIAARLSIRENTVVDHLRYAYEKLGVHSREDLRDRLLT